MAYTELKRKLRKQRILRELGRMPGILKAMPGRLKLPDGTGLSFPGHKRGLAFLASAALVLSSSAAASAAITAMENAGDTKAVEVREDVQSHGLVAGISVEGYDITVESTGIPLTSSAEPETGIRTNTGEKQCDDSTLREIQEKERAVSEENPDVDVNHGGTLSLTDDGTDGSGNEERLWMFFKSLGFTDAGAAGALGNLKMESGLDPASRTGNFDYEKSLGGGGLAGWMCHGRFRALHEMAAGEGKDWSDFDVQCRFLQYEMFTTRASVGAKMCRVTDVDYATDYFCVMFEGCIGHSANPDIDGISEINGEWYQGLERRKEYAREFYGKYAQ